MSIPTARWNEDIKRFTYNWKANQWRLLSSKLSCQVEKEDEEVIDVEIANEKT